MNYEEKVRSELVKWESEMMQEAWVLQRWSRKLQQRVDKLIPEKVHQTLSKAMEIAVKSVLSGIDMLPFSETKLAEYRSLTLVEQDVYCGDLLSKYKKIAAAEGVGTGVGGILLAAVDYPALLAIKLKFLSETAQIYGFDIREYSERVFLLKVFQLAYSGDASRKRVFEQVKYWNGKTGFPTEDASLEEAVSWREFYTEYRESIEFKKILSFIPIVGAAFSGWANYSLLDELGSCAKNAYRMRLLNKRATR
ncbi:EcsC family protein [Effusibacillus consociatus]|uniref:EcsC family protein n=1 Tax=Effusibacillus consociatus TaxID=1117041 RepID=A0ABV9PY28_9BACL